MVEDVVAQELEKVYQSGVKTGVIRGLLRAQDLIVQHADKFLGYKYDDLIEVHGLIEEELNK